MLNSQTATPSRPLAEYLALVEVGEIRMSEPAVFALGAICRPDNLTTGSFPFSPSL